MPVRPAREAVTAAALGGDAAALIHARAQFPADEAFRYDRRRAEAFLSALRGDPDAALATLGLGGGARAVRFAVDVAVVELLTRGVSHGLDAIRHALREGAAGEPDVPLILAECVRREPRASRAALGVALAGGTPLDRVRSTAAVLGARPERIKALVPAAAAASALLAAFALWGGPSLPSTDDEAAPSLGRVPPTVVVAEPAAPAAPTARRAGGGGSQLGPSATTPRGSGALSVSNRRSGASRSPAGGAAVADEESPTRARIAPRPQAPAAQPRPVPNPSPTAPPQPPPDATQVVSVPSPAVAAQPAAAQPVADKAVADKRAQKAARKAAKRPAKAKERPKPHEPPTAAAAAPPPVTEHTAKEAAKEAEKAERQDAKAEKQEEKAAEKAEEKTK